MLGFFFLTQERDGDEVGEETGDQRSWDREVCALGSTGVPLSLRNISHLPSALLEISNATKHTFVASRVPWVTPVSLSRLDPPRMLTADQFNSWASEEDLHPHSVKTEVHPVEKPCWPRNRKTYSIPESSEPQNHTWRCCGPCIYLHVCNHSDQAMGIPLLSV